MKKQNGSALVLGAIAIFMLINAVFMVLNIGLGTSKKMQIQNAADAAALAGGEVLANSLSAIAWINNGISLTHYNLVLYSQELTTLGMFAAFQSTTGEGILGVDTTSGRFDARYMDNPLLGYSKNGASAQDAYIDLYANYVGTADKPGILPRAQQFIKSLARIERGIAMMTPIMVDKQIHHVALKNGADRVAFFPGFNMFPDPNGYFKLEISRNPAVGELNQWIITESVETASTPFEVTAKVYKENGSIKKTVDGRSSWDITAQQGGQNLDNIKITAPDLPIGHNEPQNGDDLYHIDVNDGASSATIKYPNTIIGGSGKVEYLDDGTMRITDNSGVVTLIKFSDDGIWVNGVFHQNKTGTNIGGADINITNNMPLHIGDMTVYNNRLVVGRLTFWFSPFRMDIHFPVGWVQVYLDYASINGLRTNNADGRWYLTGRAGYDSRDGRDRTRHRLTKINDGEWEYEWQKSQAYLSVDNTRFAYRHLITQHNGKSVLPKWIAYGDEEELLKTFPDLQLDIKNNPQWKARWFNPLTGQREKYSDVQGTGQDRYFLRFECKYRDSGNQHPQFSKKDMNAAEEAAETSKCPNCGMNYDSNDNFNWPNDKFYMQTSPEQVINSNLLSPKFVLTQEEKQRLSGMELTTIPFVDDGQNSYISINNRPLKVTAELFKFGITVATWSAEQGEKDVFGQLSSPDGGYFAISSSRVGFYDNSIGDFRYRFDTAQDRDTWIESSDENLYQPLWRAVLYPVRLMVRSVDIDANTSTVQIIDNQTGEIDGEFQIDSGLNFLFRAIAHTGWRQSYSGTGNNVGTRLNSMHSPYSNKTFDLSGDKLKDVLHH